MVRMVEARGSVRYTLLDIASHREQPLGLREEGVELEIADILIHVYVSVDRLEVHIEHTLMLQADLERGEVVIGDDITVNEYSNVDGNITVNVGEVGRLTVRSTLDGYAVAVQKDGHSVKFMWGR